MKKILVIAPHPDDEIIGVGGTIVKNIKNGNEVYICIVTKGCEPIFPKEQVEKVQREARDCHSLLGITKSFFLDFPAAMLDTVNKYTLNGQIMNIVKEVCPDEVYIPHIGDIHSDHRIVAESSMVALRPKYRFAPKKIYSYETLSETGWNIPNANNTFIPNVYVDIKDSLKTKIKAMSIYESQLSNYPDARSLTTIECLAKYRGSLMNLEAAEAFSLIRLID